MNSCPDTMCSVETDVSRPRGLGFESRKDSKFGYNLMLDTCTRLSSKIDIQKNTSNIGIRKTHFRIRNLYYDYEKQAYICYSIWVRIVGEYMNNNKV